MFPKTMSEIGKNAASLQDTRAKFEQTHWSVVFASARQDLPGAHEALEKLCQTYWYPLYAFLRREGQRPEDAQDLTQGFLAHLLSQQRLQSVRPAKGKFRSFLLACLNNYVHNERDRVQAEKRGGGQVPIPIDTLVAEEHYAHEPADLNDPAKLFERRWAFTVVEQTLARLKEVCTIEGKSGLFDALSPDLTGDAARGDHAPAAARLGMSEGAVRVAVSRLRTQYRDLLLQEIGRTVDNQAEVDAEVLELFAEASHSGGQNGKSIGISEEIDEAAPGGAFGNFLAATYWRAVASRWLSHSRHQKLAKYACSGRAR